MGSFARKCEDGLSKVAERLARRPFVAALFARLDRKTAIRTLQRQHKRAPVIAIISTWAVLAAIATFFTYSVSTYFDWPPKAYSSPEVFNLTAAKLKWDTYYGAPVHDRALCGWIDCQLSSAWPTENYQKQVALPLHEFPLVGYAKGQTIYHRATFNLPDNLISSQDMVVFHSVYIWAKHYEFYVDGELVDSGGKSLLNITIPRRFVTRGQITLSFKIDPGDLPYQGISHFGDLVIGPREILQTLSFTARELKTTFFLWFILPRLTICLIFCFLFLAMSKNFENLTFFLFVFTSSVKLFMFSDYFEQAITASFNHIMFARTIDLHESFLFVLFIERYFRRNNPLFNRIVYGALVAATALLAAVLFDVGPVVQAVMPHESKIAFIVRIIGSAYAFYLSATTTLYLAHGRKSRSRMLSSLFLTVFMAASFCTFVGGFFNVFQGIFSGLVSYSHELILCIVLAGLVAFEFGSTVVQRDNIRSKFRLMVDPKVADQLLSSPEILKGQAREVTILFSDIRSFTTISELFPAEEVVGLLNEYFEVMVGVINAHGGVVDKFIGDAIMAVWGAPVATDRDAEMATRCAVHMRRALRGLNEAREAAGKFTISIGIGLHTGRVIAGGVGASSRVDYTVIGDTVNIAARIESLSKELKSDLLVSESTFTKVAPYAAVAPAGEFKLKGKAKALRIFKLLGVFNEDGTYDCHCPTLEANVSPRAPGIFVCAATNLIERNYEGAPDDTPAPLHQAA